MVYPSGELTAFEVTVFLDGAQNVDETAWLTYTDGVQRARARHVADEPEHHPRNPLADLAWDPLTARCRINAANGVTARRCPRRGRMPGSAASSDHRRVPLRTPALALFARALFGKRCASARYSALSRGAIARGAVSRCWS